MKNFLYRLKWWLFQKDKNCKSCCIFCNNYETCVIDITAEEIEIVLSEFDKAYKEFYLTVKERKKALARAIARGIAKALERR